MRLAKGPRPWSIRAFAFLFMAQAVIVFADTFVEPGWLLERLSANFPGFTFDQDAIIVLASARLTIFAIPVALVWWRASRMARLLVTVFAAIRLYWLPGAIDFALSGGSLYNAWLLATALCVAAVALLYTEGARSWFRQKVAAHA